MPSPDGHKLPRNGSKLDRFLPQSGNRRRPALAVDTNFTQDGRRMPEQVYPPKLDRREEKKKPITLNDITNLSRQGNEPQSGASISDTARVRPGPKRVAKNGYPSSNRISESAVAFNELPPPYKSSDAATAPSREPRVPFVLQNPPKPKSNNILNRLVPRKLSTDVSPSDARIEIGIAVPSNAMRYRNNSMDSDSSRAQAYSWRRSSNKSGNELRTPTIIITPVNDEFEARFDGLSQSGKPNTFRPRSSVYSRYTNGLSKVHELDYTPPVPPLPEFLVKDHGTAPKAETIRWPLGDSPETSTCIPSQSINERSPIVSAALREDLTDGSSSERLSRSNRFSSQTRIWNSRSSQGWWNYLTSPFSPKSTSRASVWSSSPMAEEERQRAGPSPETCLREIHSDNKRLYEENELRSAPATESSTQALGTRPPRTPKRADTAPGALDLGNAETINIYRTPSHGQASSYYDRTRHYPSLTTPLPGARLDRQVESDWSPSQSVYRGSTNALPRNLSSDNRGFSEMQIPTTGEAAPYYDANRRFSDTHGQQAASGSSQSFVETPISATAFAGRGGIMGVPDCQTPVSSASDSQNARGVLPLTGPASSRAAPASGMHRNSDGLSPERSVILDDGLHRKPSDSGSETVVAGGYNTDGALYTERPRGVEYATPRGVVDPHETSFTEGRAPPYGSRESLESKSSTDLQGGSSEKYVPSAGIEYRGTRSQEHLRNATLGDGDSENDRVNKLPWYRRLLVLLVVLGALLLLSLVVLLVIFVPEHHAGTQVQAQWLNLTGFPPLPTGVSTVAGTKVTKEVNGCVDRNALWSCAVPPAEQLSTTQPDQPNFRFLIRFRNGTVANETLVEPTNITTIKRESGRAANTGAVVRRSAWSSFLFTANPPPPSIDDQEFLGRTTDDISPPYAGEQTPFYISLLDPVALQPVKRSRLHKREFHYPYPTPSDFNSSRTASNGSSSDSSSSASGAMIESVPSPALQANGGPAPAKLYPFAYAQPLRLFDRGLSTEHYSFYTYFDRSIFLASFANGTFSDNVSGNVSNSGNVPLNHAKSVCTWSESRLLVQIWTRKPDVTRLAPATNVSIPTVNSTANDLKSPGSFPYAVSVTLDRHGGDASKKGVYCYDVGENHIIHVTGTWIKENRAFDGKIVNPAGIPTNNGLLALSDSTGGGKGIDGGTSGCECQWQNFR